MLLATIEPFVGRHGYLAVFLIIMLESAGVPLPGETVLILVAGFAGATENLDISLVIGCAAAGAIIGDNIGFWIGRRYGARFLIRYGKFIRLPRKRLKLGQHLFKKHGAKIVFFGRFVAFLRVFAALLAGANHYGWRQFLFFNAAGGVIWALVIGTGAYFFGDAMRRVSGPLGIAALIAIVLGVGGFMYFVHRKEKQMEEQLAAAARKLQALH
ncbi:MAG TPA: DedA family protein [Methylocella sp.]|nr:DedA family protein [Methylocella sp.]